MERVFSPVLVIVLLLAASPLQGAPKKPPADPGVVYTLFADALISSTDTDLTIVVGTEDGSPPPASIDRLQVKVIDPATGIAELVQNHSNVGLTDGTAVIPLPVLTPDRPIEVKATLGKGKNRQVVLANCLALLRPDLAVTNVLLPPVVKADSPALIETVVSEINADLGALFDVDLIVSGSVVATRAGVLLGPGEAVSVVLGYTPAAPGTWPASVVIRDAVPGEYDESNNVYAFDLVVLPGADPAGYNLSYEFYNSLRRTDEYAPDFSSVIQKKEEGLREWFSLGIYATDATPSWPVDLSVSVRDLSGELVNHDLVGLAPASGTEYMEELPGGFLLRITQLEGGGVDAQLTRRMEDYAVYFLDGTAWVYGHDSGAGDFLNDPGLLVNPVGGLEADVFVEGANGVAYSAAVPFCPYVEFAGTSTSIVNSATPTLITETLNGVKAGIYAPFESP